MGSLTRYVLVASLATTASACDDIAGFSGTAPPLAAFRFEVTGDFEAVRFPGATNERLHAALLWGDQWLPEPLCIFPAESPEVQAVLDAGCRDPLGFVPQRASQAMPVELGIPQELVVDALPTAEVMVGDVTSRIAYASLVIFDDRDGNGVLDLDRSRVFNFDFDPNDPDDLPPPPLERDILYASSFVSMTEPDVRVALREGGYNEAAAFYPRAGCGTPPPGFSVLAAGGFTAEEAIAATLRGELPEQDPATCSEQAPEDASITLTFRPPAELSEVRCRGRRADSSVRYRDPEEDEQPDLETRVAACASIPDFGTGKTEGITQYIVSTRADEPCRGIIHYTLRGCDEDPTCEVPEWDLTANPPSWWPCEP